MTIAAYIGINKANTGLMSGIVYFTLLIDLPSYMNLVPEPQLDTFVFCKTKNAVGAFQLDDT